MSGTDTLMRPSMCCTQPRSVDSSRVGPPVVTGTPLVSTRHSPGRVPPPSASQSSIWVIDCVGLKILRANAGISACTVRCVAASVKLTHVDTTTVSFRTLGDAEIERYIEREQPFDCAGGFKAEALGIALFERMDSQDPTAIVGLPLIWLAGALRTAGFTVP